MRRPFAAVVFVSCADAGGVHVRALSVLGVSVQGVLKGYDQLLNLVMDETVEFLRGGPTVGP